MKQSVAPQTSLLSSHFDPRDAYQDTDAGMRRLDQALSTLADNIEQRRSHQQSGLGDQNIELAIAERARDVQQLLLGNMRQPEPTNQYRAIAAEGPAAQQALTSLLEAAGRFARRDQQLVIIPSPRLFQNPTALNQLDSAVAGIRQAAPTLARLAQKDEPDPLRDLLGDPRPAAFERYFSGLAQRLGKIAPTDPTAAETPADELPASRINTDFSQHMRLHHQTLPTLTEALDSLRATAKLAEVGRQLQGIGDADERQRFAAEALDALGRRTGGADEPQAVLPASGGRLILPGTAGGQAASMAGVLVTDNLQDEITRAQALTARMQDPALPKTLVDFAKQHQDMQAHIRALFPARQSADGQLALGADTQGRMTIDLSEQARLGRMLAVRERMDQLIRAEPEQTIVALAAISAKTDPAQLTLIDQTNREAIGQGYRGATGWLDPVARTALDVEIAASANALAGKGPRDLRDAQPHMGLNEATVTRLKDKETLDALIDRFPNSAAKLPQALQYSIVKPDFAAMGVTLPAPRQQPAPVLTIATGRRP